MLPIVCRLSVEARVHTPDRAGATHRLGRPIGSDLTLRAGRDFVMTLGHPSGTAG